MTDFDSADSLVDLSEPFHGASSSDLSQASMDWNRELSEPEPVRTAADLLEIGFWIYSKRDATFELSSLARTLLGLKGFEALSVALNAEELSKLSDAIDAEDRFELIIRFASGGNESGTVLFQGWHEYPSSERVVGTITRLPEEMVANLPVMEPHPLLTEAMEHGADSLLVLHAVRGESGQPVDFEVVEANARGAELLGCSKREAKGRLIRQLLPSLENDGTIQKYAEIMQKGVPDESEFFVSPGGFQRIWIKQRVVPLNEGVAIFATDVSAARIADETSDRSRRMFERIASTTPDALVLWDVETRRLIFSNRQLAAIFSLRDPIGSNHLSSLEKQILASELERFRDYLASFATLDHDGVQEEVFRSYGSERSKYLLFRSSVFDRKPNGQSRTILSSIQDITEEASSRVELEHRMNELVQARSELEASHRELMNLNSLLSTMALTDATTGLKNRRAFQEKLDEETERAQRYNSRLALLLTDLDHFKAYNDTFGHPAGDVALKGFGQVMIEVCRRSDTVARFGGEEFAIILPNTGAVEAGRLAERISAALATTIYGERGLTSSFGCAEYVPGKEGKEKLIADADRALYRSKEEGRNRVTVAGQ